MIEIKKGAAYLGVDFEAGSVVSIKYDGQEICDAKMPLFTLGLRDNEGNPNKICVFDSKKCTISGNAALYDGRMIRTEDYECVAVEYDYWSGNMIEPVPEVYVSAWEKDGKKVQIFANHMDKPSTIKFCGKAITIPAMDGIMVEL